MIGQLYRYEVECCQSNRAIMTRAFYGVKQLRYFSGGSGEELAGSGDLLYS
jgi:hypothetical protein